jgi:hypothetical protein
VADGVDLPGTGLGEHPVDEGVERGEVVGARTGVVLVREQQVLRVPVAREAEELALELLGRARLAVDEDDRQHRPVLGQRRDVPLRLQDGERPDEEGGHLPAADGAPRLEPSVARAGHHAALGQRVDGGLVDVPVVVAEVVDVRADRSAEQGRERLGDEARHLTLVTGSAGPKRSAAAPPGPPCTSPPQPAG